MWAKSLFGGVQETTRHRCLSPSLPLSFSLSLKINKFKNDMVHIYNGILSTWIDLEGIMLSEIRQRNINTV